MSGTYHDGREPCVYRLHGVGIRSSVPLAGVPTHADDDDVDLHWTSGKPVPDDAPAGRLGASARVGGAYLYSAAVDERGCWTLRVPSLCDFVTDADRGTVECRLDPSADPAFVAVIASGLLVAFLLSLAGHCVLHASAVEAGGKAMAIAGRSGAGKSTLAALLCASGARLVTDDVLRVGFAGRAVCIGGSPHLRLRDAAAWALDTFATRPPVDRTADARVAVTPRRSRLASVPVSLIVLPRPSREVARLTLTPVKGAEALFRLAGLSRVAGWTDPDLLRAQFRSLARLAAEVPVLEAVVPWGHDGRAPIAGVLLDRLAAAG